MSQENDNELKDRRKYVRIPVDAILEFKGKRYDVIDITPDGIYIKIDEKTDAAVVGDIMSGPFKFRLVDPISETSHEYFGNLVRDVKSGETGKIIGIALVYSQGGNFYTITPDVDTDILDDE
ncbi:MAG: hypothetical protein HQM16_14040 [Deltaproteobacteria bacterium]|nr:hypothetical protein [Deltaproteobacteria bacterium]